MSEVDYGHGMRTRRKSIVVALLAASLVIVFVQDLRRASLATDRLKRIHELESREARFYDQLAQRDAQRESQRQIYIGRIRNFEAQLRDHEIEILALRAKFARSTNVSLPPASLD